MLDKTIDLHNHTLNYDNNIIYIAFDEKNLEPYFHANQLCQTLEYNCMAAIKNNVDYSDLKKLKDIVRNYKTLYKNVQGNTIFLNVAGMYSLVLGSKKEKVEEIKNWIIREVMPSLRKYKEYALNYRYKKQIEKLNKVINNQKNKIKILEHHLKKLKCDTHHMSK